MQFMREQKLHLQVSGFQDLNMMTLKQKKKDL